MRIAALALMQPDEETADVVHTDNSNFYSSLAPSFESA